MIISIENNIPETTVRKVSFSVGDISLGATHLIFSGDVSFIEGAFPVVDGLNYQISPYPNIKRSGNLMLTDGDGDKIVYVVSVYKDNTILNSGTESVVGSEIRLDPGYTSLISQSMIGSKVYTGASTYSIITDVGASYYVIDTALSITPGVNFWFDETIKIDEQAASYIKLVSSQVFVPPKPTALLDVSDFWSNIRDVWTLVDDQDKEQVERLWVGIVGIGGNLMQRLYEIDAAQSLSDMLIYRREHWRKLTSSYRKYEGTGVTDYSRPSHLKDKSRKPFKDTSLNVYGSDLSDIGSYVTIGGESYKIIDVSKVWDVELDGASFTTQSNLTYYVGGQNNSDLLPSNMFKNEVVRKSTVILNDANESVLGLKDLIKIGIEHLPGEGRVRTHSAVFGDGTTFAATPDRLYSSKKIFNSSYLGVWVKVSGVSYKISGVSSDGYYVQLLGASFSRPV